MHHTLNITSYIISNILHFWHLAQSHSQWTTLRYILLAKHEIDFQKKYCITVLYAAFSLKWMHCITVIMYIALYSTDGGVWFQIDCKAYEQILISICYSSFFTILPNANRNIKWSFTGNQTIAWPSDGHHASALLLAENSPTNDDDDDCDICDDFYGEESLLRMVPGNVDENVITAITIFPRLWWASI